MVLKLALLSLIESMRKDPDKYSQIIYNNNTFSTPTTSTTGHSSSQYYDTSSYGQQHQQYPSQDCIDVLLEEAEKLYNKLVKELVDESISDYGCSISSPSLPLLAPPYSEEQSLQRQTATIQSNMDTAEHRYLQSEIDNEDQDNLQY